MTEYEILDLISSNTSDMATMFGIYLTVVSAYLVVAYFAGHKLSLIEAVALTLLFIFAAGGQALGINNLQVQISVLLESLAEIRELNSYENNYATNTVAWVIVMLTGVVVSIVFMWSVRIRNRP